jgi:predicted protein tyrosine phosphatase
MDRKLRVLCVCQGGNVRSVCLATRLKQKHRLDALACGYEKNSADTVKMLADWADVIVVMEERMIPRIPTKQQHKVRVCEVGPDRFGASTHKELMPTVHAWADAQQWRL